MAIKTSQEIFRQYRKGVTKKKPHLLWNRVPTKECRIFDDNNAIWYFVVVGSSKLRESTIEFLATQLNKVGNVEELRDPIERLLGDSKFKYTFVKWANPLREVDLDWGKIKIPRKRDTMLYERVKKGHSVEDYIEGIYNIRKG